ncbi:MAG: ABC transporter permease [Solirubrobacterales bacterium]
MTGTTQKSGDERQVVPAGKGESDGGKRRRLPRKRPDFAGLTASYGILVAWAMVIVVFSLLEPDRFPTTANLQTILGSQSVLLILALGLIISLSVGEYDLSVAGAMSVSLVLVGYLNVVAGWPIIPAVLAALLSGVLVGLLNAFLVVVVGVESIVATLGTGTLLVGLGVAINGETTAGISESLVEVVRYKVLGLPLSFYYALAFTAIIWYCLRFTPLGRYLYFVGVNQSVARLSGLPVNRIRAGALVATSFVGALTGVIFAGTLASADPNISASFLLPAFAAAFLGSTAITPGRFNAWGTFIAVYFLVTGITGLQLLGLSGWIENVFYGASLVIAVSLSKGAARYQLYRRLRRTREGGEAG